MTISANGAARRLLSVDQACHQLGGISRSMLYNLINRGDLERVKVGNRALITHESIAAYVARRLWATVVLRPTVARGRGSRAPARSPR